MRDSLVALFPDRKDRHGQAFGCLQELFDHFESEYPETLINQISNLVCFQGSKSFCSLYSDGGFRFASWCGVAKNWVQDDIMKDVDPGEYGAPRSALVSHPMPWSVYISR